MSKQNVSIHLKDFKDKAFATMSVFTRNDMVFGLPAKVFALGIGNTATLMLFLYWPAGILFGLLFFYGMYQIHQKDPKAFDIWCHVFTRLLKNKSGRWSAGKTTSTKFIILKKGV